MATREEARRELARRELERRRGVPAEQQPAPAYSGSILPLSRDDAGNVSFDSNAGLIGAIKRAVTLPGDVLTGKTALRDAEGNIADEVIGRSFEMGATASPVNPGVRSGDMAIPGAMRAMKPEKVKPPTAEALHAAAKQGYDSVRGSDVRYAAESVNEMARKVADGVFQEGFIPENAPITNKILADLQRGERGAFSTPGMLDVARQALNKIQPGTPDHAAAQRVIRGLDEFIMGDHAPGAVAGPSAAVGRELADARGNYASAKRSDQLTGIEDAAGLRAAAANSGHNLDNSIRSRIASLLGNDRAKRGFTAAEEQVLEQLVKGTVVRNRTRDLGNVLGGGGGLGAVAASTAGAGAGMAAGSPALMMAGAMSPLIGHGAKRVANALTSRELGKVDKMTRARSPLHQKMQDEAPMTAIDPAMHAAIVRALMLSQSQAQN